MYSSRASGKMSATSMDVSEEELQLYFQEWVTQSKKLKILVTGQVGTGKSALINSLIETTDANPGSQVAAEGDSAVSVTSEVGIYTLNKNGVDMVLYDSPGLLDPDLSKLDPPTFQKIQAQTGGEIDLLLICKKMGSRLDSGDIRIMQQITEYMGESVWKNAVYVLTFANEVKPPRRRGATQPTKVEEYFETKKMELEDIIHEYLQEEGRVATNIAIEVPVVPAGYDDPSLPGCNNWYDALWLNLCSQIKAASQPAFLKVVQIPEALSKELSVDQPKSATEAHSIVSDLLHRLQSSVPAIRAKFNEFVSKYKHKKD